MSDPTEPSSSREEFDALMLALGSGQISDAQHTRLSEIVESDPEAREIYLEYMMADAALQWQFGAIQGEGVGEAHSPSATEVETLSAARGRRKRRWPLAVAAAICLGLGVALIIKSMPPKSAPGPVADDQAPSAPTPAPPGSDYAARVDVPGWSLLPKRDAEFEVLPDESVRLVSGELYAAASDPAAAGRQHLIIHTPDGEINASGTRLYVSSVQFAPGAPREELSTPDNASKDMRTPNPIRTLTRVFLIAGVAAITNNAGSAQGDTGDQLEVRDGNSPQKLQKDGNFKEAYEIYSKLLVDPAHGGEQAAKDVAAAHNCLSRLNRIAEWDALAEQVVATHGGDWRVLRAVAMHIQQSPHFGSMVGEEFQRGSYRGRHISTVERDRIHALQLFSRALGVVVDEEDRAAVANFHFDFARTLNPTGASWHYRRTTWRLQTLTDLQNLPDYGVPTYHSPLAGAAVDGDNNPLYYEVPADWDNAANDGERWRWMVAQMVKADPGRAAAAKLEYARFLRSQFDVHTMGFAPRLGENGQPEAGLYAVHTLEDNETIARLATGIQRWKLPERHNFISLLKEVAAQRPERPASPIKDLTYKVYHGDWDKLPDFEKLEPAAQGALDSGRFDLTVAGRREHFGVVFEGNLRVEESGDYTFWIHSDDGSALSIGDTLEIDNDGLHGVETGNKGTTKLTEGDHPIRLTYFEKTGDESLFVSWQGPATGGKRQFLSVNGSGTTPAEQALDELASVYENRLQYPQAAAQWREAIEHFGPGHRSHRRDRLSQIVDNWGRFDDTSSFTKGGDNKLGYVFRNGENLKLRATAVKVEALLDDIKAYLKSNPAKTDNHKINPSSIGYRLVTENEQKFLGEVADEWRVELEPRENHWDRRVDVALPMDEAGAYLVEGTIEGGNTTRIIVWISDTAIVSKPLHQHMLYMVTDSTSGKPVPGANVEFFGYRSVWESKEKGKSRLQTYTRNFAENSDAQGLVLPAPDDLAHKFRWLVTAREPGSGRLAILGFNGVWGRNYHAANHQASKAYAVTDRPLYQPGATVNFKAWVRAVRYDMAWVSHFAGKEFQVQINDPKGETIYDKRLTTGELGGLNGSLDLPDDATLGAYSLSIVAEPYVNPFTNKQHRRRHFGNTSFRVEEYKKPEFEVVVEPPTEPTKLGDKITATVRASYYFGAPCAQREGEIPRRAQRPPPALDPAAPLGLVLRQGLLVVPPGIPLVPGLERLGLLDPTGRQLEPG